MRRIKRIEKFTRLLYAFLFTVYGSIYVFCLVKEIEYPWALLVFFICSTVSYLIDIIYLKNLFKREAIHFESRIEYLQHCNEEIEDENLEFLQKFSQIKRKEQKRKKYTDKLQEANGQLNHEIKQLQTEIKTLKDA